MMDCASYRRALLADPRVATSEELAHAATCHECAAFTSKLQRFEHRLRRALGIDIPLASPLNGWELRAANSRHPRMRGWLAIAASLLVAFIVAGGLWVAIPGPSLAADVVAHMAEEPAAWKRTAEPVPSQVLDAVLRDAHVRLRSGAGPVTYARSCSFRGHQVPHLVVRSEDRSVTVMVLAHENSPQPVAFNEQGYRGVIVPVPGHGSLAVLAQSSDGHLDVARGDVARVAARVLGNIDWTK